MVAGMLFVSLVAIVILLAASEIFVLEAFYAGASSAQRDFKTLKILSGYSARPSEPL
ncbi:hypothetical protein DSM104440_02790 [Usitatibacter palustris]|uniref:Uncharacterized protein n=1 Tax=Usitatibacter palustris TaxID=2732487 RepID=A0A6M4H9M7_9PROT|nr:hypothetical protein DSM104440_02790 [Usitatibacter palustris]